MLAVDEIEKHPYLKTAFQALRELPDFRSQSYLELGCGDGFILEALSADGVRSLRGTTYRKRAVDYIRTREYPKGAQVDEGIDLNQPLPYADASFDVVYSTEVIEHVEGHRNFMMEATRVLKPGGHLIMTTPNIQRLLSRISFLLSGIHLTGQALIPWNYGPQRMEEFHHRCIDFPVYHWLLWVAGMRIQEIRPTEKLFSMYLSILMWPLLRIPTALNVMRHAKDQDDIKGRKDLMKWMLSRAILGSNTICIIARKQ
jgi:SAM-dependent methyltransferase